MQAVDGEEGVAARPRRGGAAGGDAARSSIARVRCEKPPDDAESSTPPPLLQRDVDDDAQPRESRGGGVGATSSIALTAPTVDSACFPTSAAAARLELPVRLELPARLELRATPLNALTARIATVAEDDEDVGMEASRPVCSVDDAVVATPSSVRADVALPPPALPPQALPPPALPPPALPALARRRSVETCHRR